MIRLKQILLGGVAFFALSGAVLAADVPINRPAPAYKVAPAPAFSWQGQYIGVHGGYAWGSNDVNVVGVVGEISPSRGVGGIQFGYNHHLSQRWLVGYEIDASFGNLNDSAFIGGIVTPVEMRYFGTARARLGYTSGPWLFYATAGAAWTDVNLTGVAAIAAFKRPHVGYVIGAGVEYALTQNWSAKIEYLYADLDSTASVINGATINTDLAISTVRVGLNYRFANWNPTTSPNYYTKAPAQVSGWTGPYMGVHAGYGWGTLDAVGGGVAQSLEATGGFGGITSGYNWQISRNLVIGVEGDSSWGSISETAGGANVDIDALGTIRGRIGYAMNNVLFYGTGGLAWAHAESNTNLAARDQYYLGWAAGVGVEYAFNSRWSAKLEYMYSDFGTIRDFNGGAVNASLDVSTIKLGINYRAGIFDLINARW
jgi:outer membrane immunogenic protein